MPSVVSSSNSYSSPGAGQAALGPDGEHAGEARNVLRDSRHFVERSVSFNLDRDLRQYLAPRRAFLAAGGGGQIVPAARPAPV